MFRGEILSDVDEARSLARALAGSAGERALETAARRVRVSKWSLWSLYHGRRKTVGYSTLAALRREYLRLCERQIARLEAEVRDLKRKCGDDSVVALGAAVARVAEKVRKAREVYG